MKTSNQQLPKSRMRVIKFNRNSIRKQKSTRNTTMNHQFKNTVSSTNSESSRQVIKLHPAKPDILTPVRSFVDVRNYSDRLLFDLATIVRPKKQMMIRTQDLIAELCSNKSKPWCSYNHGSNITARQLAFLLKPYGLFSQGLWVKGSGSFKGYNRRSIRKAYKALIVKSDLVYPVESSQSSN
jgi:hypothetical protein